MNLHCNQDIFPASNYKFKVNNRNTRTRCEICSKLTIKTPMERYTRQENNLRILSFKGKKSQFCSPGTQ